MAEPHRRRRRWRWLLPVVGYAATLLAGLPFAWPYDLLVNAGSVPYAAELAVQADGARRVVVLQHGLWRSSWALARIARTLAAHGYEVHNLDYPSTAAYLADHAARLQAAVEAIAATGGPIAELHFVGHSMGGLVIQEYLRRPDARPAGRCVYIGTPHRGAVLADLRRHWFLFAWAMGDRAPLQLATGDPFHTQAIPAVERSGAIVGDLGQGNPSIPGPDDGTVGVTEATLPGAADVIRLPFGHTAITSAPEVSRQVLHFLRRGAFARDGGGR